MYIPYIIYNHMSSLFLIKLYREISMSNNTDEKAKPIPCERNTRIALRITCPYKSAKGCTV